MTDKRALHIKIDTGMGRLGIFPRDAAAFLAPLIGLPGLVIEGIFTHLSVADGASEWEVADTAQLAAFEGVLADLGAAGSTSRSCMP